MTLLEKLQTYETAIDLLVSIPDYPWPDISLAWGVTEETDKVGGLVNIQAWYDTNRGWCIVVTERWRNDEDESESSRYVTDELTSTQARDVIEGVG